MKLHTVILPFFLLALLAGSPASAFQKGGCGAGDCRDCHAVSKEEVAELLTGKVSEVLEVKRSEVPGLWDVEAVVRNKQGTPQKVPLYLDFSKSYLISGNVLKLESDENVTKSSFVKMNTVDRSRIPLEDALLLGKADAAHQIIVFDDPECKFCRKLHPVMKKVVEDHPDIAFLVKMFPLIMHPHAKQKAQTIVCAKIGGDNAKALSLLDESLAGKSLPEPECENDAVEKNITLGKELYIGSTPTLIMPDGRVIPGYRDADEIVKMLKETPK
ncbi:MAG: DsbC family protein [Candidatus Electrothrix sp. YB6]